MAFISIGEAVQRDGLRLVIVRNTPSPWGQAAKAMMEYKGLDFALAGQEPGGENAELVAWAGINSGPVVAWNDEPPIHRWDDILMLLERLAPQRPLLPRARRERALALGLAHEICGEGGLGWNRRLELFHPAMQMSEPPLPILNMARKYHYDAQEAEQAVAREIETLALLDAELTAQRAQGRAYFVGDMLSAVDFYWAAFSAIIKLPPASEVPVPDGFRPMFEILPPALDAALTPLLLEHRDRLLRDHFRLPMVF